MYKNLTRNFVAAIVGAFLLALAFPATAFSAPAITSLTMDRTTVQQGQSITFSVRTTAQTQFVFATISGTRAQGTRINTDTAGNHNWQITVSPTASGTVNVFANSANVEAGAASMSVPITVTGANTATNTNTTNPVIPLPPATGNVDNIGAVGIANLRETPAIAHGQVRLTFNTGPEANYTWVRFDDNNYVRGTMIEQNLRYRTWTIDFRPRTWAVQQVQVGSNRTFHYTGAALQNLHLTLAHPFVPPTDPEIRGAVITPREVPAGGRQTIRVTTNEHVGAVWIRDVDGWEANARSVAPNTTTTRTWEVEIHPSRSGTITIFANTTRVATGAVQRQEAITVRGQSVNIHDARANRIGNSDSATVRVTTTRDTESVWVVMGTRTVHLRLDRTSGNIREWVETIDNASLPMEVRASSNRNHVGVDDILTIRSWGTTHWGDGGGSGNNNNNNNNWHFNSSWGDWGRIEEIRVRDDQEPRRSGSNSEREFIVYVITNGNVDNVEFVGSNVAQSQRMSDWNLGGGRREWRIRVRVHNNASTGNNTFFVEATTGSGSNREVVGEGRTPNVWVRN
ncbi:MAG: hypothetical protein FWE05_12420 [Defluviitaleaceae bacterium]|nr:hypothetical protein [Defluviitaleaceae bacterium]